MRRAKTFDEVFDQLYDLYKGKWIQIQVRKAGLLLSDFAIHVEDLEIRPLEDQKLIKNMGFSRKDKLGAMVFKGNHQPGDKVVDSLNIPFKLGLDTLDAHFIKNKVAITSCGFEFKIKGISRMRIS